MSASTRKPVPRAVLEERLRVYEEKQARRRLFAVEFGVYMVNVLGVLASQAVLFTDNISAVLAPVELGQVGGALVVSTIVYAQAHTSKVDVVGMAKKGNVFRVMLTAFSNGFMWQVLLGAWW